MILSIAAAELAACTLGSALIAKLFEILTYTGFSFVIEPFDTWVLVPLLSASVIMLAAYIKIISAKNVSLHDISEE